MMGAHMEFARRESSSRYREIYQRLRGTIEGGVLRPGDQLPSARTLANEFNAARGTVETALALLTGEGFVVALGRKGRVVSPVLPPSTAANASPGPGPWVGEPYAHLIEDPAPLTPGLPAFDLFPRKLWSQLVSKQARRSSAADLTYIDPLGLPRLRSAIAGYLGVARGVSCAPQEVFITGGYLSALALVLRAMTAAGDTAWVESPGYPLTRRAVELAGIVAAPVPVDAEGMDVGAGIASAPGAKLAVVAPANQFPLGVSLSLRRRKALLDWARSADAWIVEDDYTGEFRHDGWPLPSLKSLDRDDRVFYVGTFSKTMFPALRLGYLVAPASQQGRIRSFLHNLDGGRPALEQATLADFILDGHFARHIKRMRAAYRLRRQGLEAALQIAFGDRFQIHPTSGGLQIVAALKAAEDDVLLENAAAVAGLRPRALSPMAFGGSGPRGLLLGFGNVPEDLALPIARRLAEALPTAASGSPRTAG